MLHLVGYTWKYVCDAGTHGHQMGSLLLQNEYIVMCDVNLLINSLISSTFVNVIWQLYSQHHLPPFVLTGFNP